MRISDWSSDVCSSDLINLDQNARSLAETLAPLVEQTAGFPLEDLALYDRYSIEMDCNWKLALHNFLEGYHTNTVHPNTLARSEEHTSELQSLMRISYAVFCLKTKKQNTTTPAEPP